MLDKGRIEASEKSCHLEAVFGNLSDAVILLDSQLRIVSLNPAATNLFGYTLDELRNRTTECLFASKADCTNAWRKYDPQDAERSHPVLEIRCRRKDGPIFYAESHGAAVFDCEGKQVGYIDIYRDITERKELEDELRRSRDELEVRVRERTAEMEKRSKELEDLNAKLHELNQKISREHRQRVYLSRRLVGLLEMERREVAYVLHEKTAQVLAALKIELEQIESGLAIENVSPFVQSAKKKIHYLIDSVKDTSRLLRPSILDTLGMVSAIRSLIHRLHEESTGLKIELFVRDIPERIHPEKEIAIFRIIQEALCNCIKHADAKKINVNLFRKKDVIVLTVEDDGRGFDYDSVTGFPEQAEGPLGITIMRERAVQLGGEFWIETAPGKGTYVSAKIPADGPAGGN